MSSNNAVSNLGGNSPSVLLTDTNRWPSPARVAMALAQTGCRISALCPTGHPLLYTHAVARTFRYSGLSPLASLEAAIDEVKPDIVIPCDDRGVAHLHELFLEAQLRGSRGEYLSELIERSLGSRESFPVVSSRFKLLEAAAQEGVRTPRAMPIGGVNDIEIWCADRKFPTVLKADGTFGGRGVRIARNQTEATNFFLALHKPHSTARVIKRFVINRDPFWIRPWIARVCPSIVAQDYIAGQAANCAVFCSAGKLLAGIGVETVSSDGPTGPATVVRLVDDSQMISAAEKIVRKLNLSGFIGLDFMIDAKTGLSYLIEMNPRCTPLSHFRMGRGRDLPGAAWAQLAGRPVPDEAPMTQKELIAYFPQAWASKSDLLPLSFQDLPHGEPDLIRELLRPWPNRSFLFRVGSALTTPLTQKSVD